MTSPISSTSTTIYFVAAYDFTGFVDADGNTIPYEYAGSDEFVADDRTLYVAEYDGSTVTVTPYVEYAGTDSQDSGGGGK